MQFLFGKWWDKRLAKPHSGGWLGHLLSVNPQTRLLLWFVTQAVGLVSDFL